MEARVTKVAKSFGKVLEVLGQTAIFVLQQARAVRQSAAPTPRELRLGPI
jgi:hypothetical protein